MQLETNIDIEKLLMIVIPYLNKEHAFFQYLPFFVMLFPIIQFMCKDNFFTFFQKPEAPGITIISHLTIQKYGNDKICRQKFSDTFKAVIHEITLNYNIDKFKEVREIFGNDDNWNENVDFIRFPISKEGAFLYHFDYFNEKVCNNPSDYTCEIWIKSNLVIDEDVKEGKPEMTIYSDQPNNCPINVYLKFLENQYQSYLKNKDDQDQLFMFEIEKIYYEEHKVEMQVSKTHLYHHKNETNFFHDRKAEILQYINPFTRFHDTQQKFGLEKSEFERKCMKIGKPFRNGFLLYGPPGNGKTSFIKFIQKHTNRHVFFINLSLFKNDQELKAAIPFRRNIEEKTYTSGELIYVFEDCDAQCDWIKKRPLLLENDGYSPHSKKEVAIPSSNEELNKELLKSTRETPTLSCLLNLLDGPNELNGTMFIFTTNHPETLDPALTRPGRMDHKIEFKHASLQIIRDMFAFYFSLETQDMDLLDRLTIKDYILSICTVQNILCKYCFQSYSRKNCEKCIEELILECQIMDGL